MAQITLPTALPPGVPVLDIPTEYTDLWQVMPHAVQTWQIMDEGQQQIGQVLALVMLILLGVAILVKSLRNLMNKVNQV